MIFKKRVFPLLFALALIGLSAYLYKRYRIAPEIDFPKVEVVDLKGKPTSLDELSEDRLTLVVFWATWCSVCREEIPYLQKLQEAYSGNDFQVVMISDEPLETLQSFASDTDLPFVFLKLKSKSADLEVHKIPTAYLIRDGKSLDDEVGLYDWSGEEGRERIEAHLN